VFQNLLSVKDILFEDYHKISKIYRWVTFISKLCVVAYFIYVVFINAGQFYFNIIFGSIGVFFVVYDFVALGKIENIKFHIPAMNRTNKKQAQKEIKMVKQKQAGMHKVKRIVGLIDVSIDVIVVFYTIYATTTHVTIISIFMAILIAVTWIIRVLVSIITCYITSRKKLLATAFALDIPFNSVNNWIQNITGEITEEEKEKYKEVLLTTTTKRQQIKKAKPGIFSKLFKKK